MANTSVSLVTMVEGIKTLTKSALSGGTAEGFETLEQHVNRFESSLRELEQSQLSGPLDEAIKSLSAGRALSPNAQAAVRAVIVGDAESYLEMENNFKDWIAELQRLAGEMHRLAQSSSPQNVAQLRGITKDAVRLLPNIRSYAEEKDRLDRFNAVVANLDKDNRELLVQLLREKLESPTR